MLLLAFDTATPAITVALHDGSAVLAESTTVDARRTGELLAPGITAVLDAAGHKPGQLTGIAVGVGPGPFTGLRVGLVTARALGDTLGIPVHGVCTLDVVAYQTGSAEPFAVATDARRKEVYWAQYTDHLTRSTEPDVAHPALIAERLSGLAVAGQGAVLYPEAFPKGIEPRHPSAAALAELVVQRLKHEPDKHGPDSLLFPEPLYLRRPDAVEPGTRKRVSTG